MQAVKPTTSGINSSGSGSTRKQDGGTLTPSPPIENAHAKDAAKGPAHVLVPILTYCACSLIMIFTNKLVLSSYAFDYPSVVLLFQSAVAVVLLKGLHLMGFIELDPITMPRIRKWLPVTLFFGVTLYTGSKSLVYLSIPIVTVFKNMTNLVVAYGDYHFFGQRVTRGVILSFSIIVLGSILTGASDINFSLAGYIWMSCNCIAQAGYVLYAKHAKQQTSLSEWGMSFYNNFLVMFMMAFSSIVTNELRDSLRDPVISNPQFLISLVISGVVGTALSFSVFWVITATSPTTQGMVGSLNKIPIAIASILFFKDPMSWKLLLSIGIGLISGVLYTVEKIKMRAAASNSNSNSNSKPDIAALTKVTSSGTR